ncbi:MAG: thioredoxin family protein, partial [Proteobacteria bacterium]
MGIDKSLLRSHMKKIFTRVLMLALASAYAQSCSLMGGKDKSVGANQEIHASQPQPEVWFKGNVDEAFKIAKKDKKMVFLYWGAVWCPPCNELKQQIFSKPRFAELMTNFVPVYLDGDTEAAQIWGEKFQASGYPTVLILDENQKELFRLSTVLSIEEFDGAVQSVLASSGSLERAASAVMESRAKHKDLLVLAYSSWDQLPEAQWPASRRINLMEQAFESAETSPEKSIFGSQWITQLVAEKTKLSEKLLQRVFA